MTAKDAISPLRRPVGSGLSADGLLPVATVDAGAPLTDVLQRLLDSPTHELGVADGKSTLGVIDSDSMLAALGRMIASRDDCSLISLECDPGDYSASLIARAVEDADAHMVDLWSAPAADGKILVTIRVRLENPESAVRSLRRYGYEVVEAIGGQRPSYQVERDRLSALQAYLNV